MPKHPYYPNVLIQPSKVQKAVSEGAQLVEVDLDPSAFDHGHIPGAIGWQWENQLRSPVTQEILNQVEFEQLMGQSGITPETPVLLYGDNNNWFACWAFWLMRLYGHENVRLIDGGARKWLSEKRPLTFERVNIAPVTYRASGFHAESRASIENIFQSFFDPNNVRLVDVRSGGEFAGRMKSAGEGATETCALAGHIPTAVNIPWNLNCHADGTFKSPDELQSLYESFGVRRDMTVITYCAIGERASLSWFVLKHLLGYEVVMNYDKSMAQWSRLANAPLETGEAA
ncbi:MAG TPA: sulfurtransferase [Fimbriimonadaceae bacterium]|jgi:thiosulfate/3-mercaptopyruvate sulfurtransferase